MYENDKVDIKGSILIELSRVLNTSTNYLPGQEECEEDLLEIITVYKNLKCSKTKEIALEQMKLLATIHPTLQQKSADNRKKIMNIIDIEEERMLYCT